MKNLGLAVAEKVALSLVLLRLLAPKAFGVGYHALSLPGVLRARVWVRNWGGVFQACPFFRFDLSLTNIKLHAIGNTEWTLCLVQLGYATISLNRICIGIYQG